jgi:Carboxypeptidase regulatory-like domain/TonB dependent receptor-like, beta-barrel
MKRMVVVSSLVVLLGCLPSLAQTFTAIAEGTVYDATKAAVPGASVVVKGATVERAIVADARGFYRAVALPAGIYTITASHPGFAQTVLTGVTLVLDHTVTVNVTLKVAARSESISVTATTPLVDTTDSSIRQVVDSRTIDAIPLNGRNYLDLVQLSPGVTVNTEARSDLTNRDTKGAILGERAGNAAFLVNGLENNDDFHGGVFQSFTQDAIQEFEVVESNYKPEFGRGSGGIVNVVTKSGTNAFHGNAFLFIRNDALDTSNVPDQPPPPLTRYDFGGTLGGPVRKDKAWFFGSFEHFQEDRGVIFNPNIPDLLRSGENFNVVPQGRNILGFGKYTQHLTPKNDLRVEYSYTRYKNLNDVVGAMSLPSNSLNNLAKTMLGTISLTTIFNPKLVLDSSFSVRGQNFDQNTHVPVGESFEVFFVDGGGTFDFGPPTGSVQTLHQRYYTGRETLSLFSGAHSAKFGFEFIRTTAIGVNGQGLQDVIVTTQPSFALYGTASFQIPQGVAFLNPGDDRTNLANNGISFFGQDDWKVSRKLLLSYGLRYDYDSKFATSNVAPRLGLTFSPDNDKTLFRASWGLFYDRYRLGIVQAVPEFGGFNGQTVVELDYPRLADDALPLIGGSLAGACANSGGGPTCLNTQFSIPTGQLVTSSNIQSLTGMTPSQFVAAVNSYLGPFGLGVPVSFSPSTGYLTQNLSAAFSDEVLAHHPFRTPYNASLNVGVQRQLTPNLVVGATYIHRDFHDILGLKLTNLSPDARNGGALTTDGGPLQRTYGSWYGGHYDAGIVTVNKRFSKRFQMQANYIHAKSIDNLLNSNLGLGIAAQGGGAVPTDNLNLNFDRGNSDLAVADSFVASGVVTAPGNVWVSSVFHATSGTYFTASGTPTDYDGDGIVSTRPPGTSRNQFRGPATENLDMRVEKRFVFAEWYTASAMVEFFNLANARNPQLIDNFFVNGVPGPTFGTTLVPVFGREIQFGCRFQW